MAGLAGYVEGNTLTPEGISRACDGLLEFRKTLDALELNQVYVFATASLRNVDNTLQAVEEIRDSTGFSVKVLTGEEEALYGYQGAMMDLNMADGVFVDIGGASTEMVTFSHGALAQAASIPVGSLKLYRDCVKKLLPSQSALEQMSRLLERALESRREFDRAAASNLACVGGTARAVLKLARSRFHLPRQQRDFTVEQLDDLCQFLFRADRSAIDLILKTEPERIHTLIPGMMILQKLAHRWKAGQLVVSQYGVREGYLCQEVQSRM